MCQVQSVGNGGVFTICLKELAISQLQIIVPRASHCLMGDRNMDFLKNAKSSAFQYQPLIPFLSKAPCLLTSKMATINSLCPICTWRPPHRELAQATPSQQQSQGPLQEQVNGTLPQDPVLQRASCSAYCWALIILKFIMMIECRAHSFILHWASQIT